MKKFLRENPTIAFGLGLPVLLVIVFLLVSGLPALFVDPPKYDVLYATGYYDYQNGVQISVVNNKVEVVYQGVARSSRKPRLWRFNPGTGAVKEISIILPPGLPMAGSTRPTPEELTQSTVINVPDLEGLTVDSSSISPDGYEFSTGSRYSRNIFGGLFYGSRYRYEAVLTKDGRSVRLPNVAGSYYGNSTRFIGWVVSS
jgi:hypothetical protein